MRKGWECGTCRMLDAMPDEVRYRHVSDGASHTEGARRVRRGEVIVREQGDGVREEGARAEPGASGAEPEELG